MPLQNRFHKSPLIIALDFPDRDSALKFVRSLNPAECNLKVGKELFVNAGPDLVKELVDLGFAVFLDLKFHDIPQQVANACKAAAKLNVFMLTLHVSGGLKMLQAAKLALADCKNPPLLMGVTVLTSLTDADLAQLGFSQSASELVLHFASLAKTAQLDGVICSPQEVALLREKFADQLCLTTPGIRLEAGHDDQQRTLTPRQARQSGVDFIVVGRPITQAENPPAMIERILLDLQ